MSNDHTAAIPPRGFAKFGDGAKRLSLREVQDALAACARLALFAAGRIQLSHDEVEGYMSELMELMETTHDASPKVAES